MEVAAKKWTIIILANLENDSFLKIHELYTDIKKGIKNYITGEKKHENQEIDVNFILLADKHRVTVDPLLPQEYQKFKGDEYRFVDIYSITAGADDDYHLAKPFYIERDYKRDNLHKTENLEFFFKKIKDEFPAERYGFIYKSHGGNSTDIFGRFVESLLFKVTPDIKDVVVKTLAGEDADGDIEKVVERIWGKPHYPQKWNSQPLYEVESDDDDAPQVVLATYKGYVKDEDKYELQYKSLADCLQNVFGNDGVSFVLFDCCWGLRYEMAGLFNNVSKYIVGSVDESPLVGIGYDIWTSRLLKFPGMRDEEIAKMLVAQFYISRFNDYMDFGLSDPSIGNFYHYGVSMTCLDMKKYNQTSVLFAVLVDNLIFLLRDGEPIISRFVTKAIHQSRKKCKDYTYTLPGDAYPIFNIDFVWFLVNLIHQLESVLRKFPNTEYSSIIMDTIGLCKKIVIELKLNLIIGLCQNNYATPVLIDNLEYLGGYGISITFPSNADLMAQEGSNLKDFKNFPEYQMSHWTEFLELFFKKVKEFEINPNISSGE